MTLTIYCTILLMIKKWLQPPGEVISASLMKPLCFLSYMTARHFDVSIAAIGIRGPREQCVTDSAFTIVNCSSEHHSKSDMNMNGAA